MKKFWSAYEPSLLTDLYELTMAASYFREGKNETATFSLHIRDCPPTRNYFVAAGLSSFLEIIEDFSFSKEALDYLRSLDKFDNDFLSFLQKFRFTGTVRALPEGTIFFPQEPIIEITAPIIEAQILETVVMNTFHIETLIASKAARCVEAASGRMLVDFSLRRTHGCDAGVKVARSSYMVGFAGTSNIIAGKLYNIPVFGTMAHSYITSFDRELDAFLAYAQIFPNATVLLLDTYDTIRAAHKAVEVARFLEARGSRLRGVRLDSGNLLELSHKVREILDQHGLHYVDIMASGGLDEYSIHDLLIQGAPINAFGVGTKMGVSADAPYLDMAYKLVEYKNKPILKLSPGKRTWVGKKQIYRKFDSKGMMDGDLLTLSDHKLEMQPLLEEFVSNGKVVKTSDLGEARERFAAQYSTLPDEYKNIHEHVEYSVEISKPLRELEEEVAKKRLILER
ncbi:MAG: nicotinate phosphoribosyltransferase [Deltaproteobacteria bacterium]|nr:nicotinate phosphoribosyltransferase [Deltaproteobacteria bacterium]MBW2069357.1 nicotinate phosphoribosyltransferase [Deltaproteobacteria bacterium]